MTVASSVKHWTGAALAAPVIWIASIANAPLKAWQRATGTGGMAAFQIPARRVWGSHVETGFQDNVAEFWSHTANQWILVLPHLNTHFEA